MTPSNPITAIDVLIRAREDLRRLGYWARTNNTTCYITMNNKTVVNATIQGAIYAASMLLVNPNLEFTGWDKSSHYEASESAINHLIRFLGVPYHELSRWNDDPARTLSDVIAALDGAIDLANSRYYVANATTLQTEPR